MIDINLKKLPIDITDHMRKFRLVLISCWPHLDEIMEDHDWESDEDFLDDWLNTNWELLVERKILKNDGILTPLSIPLPESFLQSTKRKFKVQASFSELIKKNYIEINFPINTCFRFFCFCTNLDRGGFGMYPPFDYAGLIFDEEKKIFYIPFAFLNFNLVRFSKN